MTTFDKREEAFEKKFVVEEELRFKAEARRNKLLGLWAAEKLGKSGPAADAYAKEVIAAEFEEGRDAGVLRGDEPSGDGEGDGAPALARLHQQGDGQVAPEDETEHHRGMQQARGGQPGPAAACQQGLGALYFRAAPRHERNCGTRSLQTKLTNGRGSCA